MTKLLLLELNFINELDLNNFIGDLVNRTNREEPKAWLKSNLKNFLKNDLTNARPLLQLPPNSPAWAQRAVERGDKLFSFEPNPDVMDQYYHLVDWLNALDENTQIYKNLSRLSVPDAEKFAQEWLKNQIKKSSEQEDEKGIIDVMKLPNGFKWVDLTTAACLSREGKLMGHCVGSYGNQIQSGTKIYSLRDYQNVPHATLSVIQNQYIDQVKGKQNRPPDKKYQNLTIEFLNHLGLPPREHNTDIDRMGLVYDSQTKKYTSVLTASKLVGELINNWTLWQIPSKDTQRVFLIVNPQNLVELQLGFNVYSYGSTLDSIKINDKYYSSYQLSNLPNSYEYSHVLVSALNKINIKLENSLALIDLGVYYDVVATKAVLSTDVEKNLMVFDNGDYIDQIGVLDPKNSVLFDFRTANNQLIANLRIEHVSGQTHLVVDTRKAEYGSENYLKKYANDIVKFANTHLSFAFFNKDESLTKFGVYFNNAEQKYDLPGKAGKIIQQFDSGLKLVEVAGQKRKVYLLVMANDKILYNLTSFEWENELIGARLSSTIELAQSLNLVKLIWHKKISDKLALSGIFYKAGKWHSVLSLRKMPLQTEKSWFVESKNGYYLIYEPNKVIAMFDGFYDKEEKKLVVHAWRPTCSQKTLGAIVKLVGSLLIKYGEKFNLTFGHNFNDTAFRNQKFIVQNSKMMSSDISKSIIDYPDASKWILNIVSYNSEDVNYDLVDKSQKILARVSVNKNNKFIHEFREPSGERQDYFSTLMGVEANEYMKKFGNKIIDIINSAGLHLKPLEGLSYGIYKNNQGQYQLVSLSQIPQVKDFYNGIIKIDDKYSWEKTTYARSFERWSLVKLDQDKKKEILFVLLDPAGNISSIKLIAAVSPKEYWPMINFFVDVLFEVFHAS